MKEKTFFLTNIMMIVTGLFLLAMTMIVVDPYFHYHKPLKFLAYRLGNQRYMNNGIIKHFEYDAMIIGTSMTENFKTSQFDELFKVHSIKVPFSGGSFKEIDENIRVALNENKNIKYVLRGLDYGGINQNYEHMRYSNYPEYLYNNFIWDDYQYWWNKEICLKGLGGVGLYTIKNKKTTSFDEYSYWSNRCNAGKEEVLKEYIRLKKEDAKQSLDKDSKERIRKNIYENVIKTAMEYPNVKFLYFITPYSIIYWDELHQKNKVEKQILAETVMIEEILKIPNIQLYSFFNNYDLIVNLDNYKDPGHYMGNVNSEILHWIKEGKYKITKENYQQYLEGNLKFYENYNYDSIYEYKKNVN